MRVRILGCSGGIGAGLKTTCIRVDDDIVIDAGTGLGELTLDELRAVRHVFLTHSHLDHTACLPLFIDTVFEARKSDPLQIYALPETIAALNAHMFNWVMWPNFSELPSAEQPVIRYNPIAAGDLITVDGRKLRAVDVHHGVPAVGFCLEGERRIFAFSGDTMTNDSLWPLLNDYHAVEFLVIEVSFPNRQAELAHVSGHYCPRTLAADIQNLDHRPELWITAMKPGEEEIILEEVSEALPDFRISVLRAGATFEL